MQQQLCLGSRNCYAVALFLGDLLSTAQATPFKVGNTIKEALLTPVLMTPSQEVSRISFSKVVKHLPRANFLTNCSYFIPPPKGGKDEQKIYYSF